jgi:hypothetical protein
MKKILLANLLALLSTAGFSQATRTFLGLGFRDNPTSHSFLNADPANTTVTGGNGFLIINAGDSLDQYAPVSYTLNDGAGGSAAVNFGATHQGYIKVWAKATNPVNLRIEFANTSNPQCLCPQDRSANAGNVAYPTLTTTMTSYVIGPVTNWKQDYSSVVGQNGTVDSTGINQINIYASPLTSAQKKYHGIITIDSIFISDSPLVAAVLNANLVSNSTKLFPNPVADRATLSYELIEGSNVKLVLNDMTGRPVRILSDGYKNAGITTESINVSDLEQGIYNVSFVVNGAAAKMERFIVK